MTRTRGRRAARLLTTAAATLTTTLLLTAPAPAAEQDAVTVRLYTATFNGTGHVRIPDGAAPTVKVTSLNTSINDDECSAVVALGVAAPEVFRCTFNYLAPFRSEANVYCTGTARAAGRFVVFLPDGAHAYDFDITAVVDEATAHGVGTTYVDVGTGRTATGYAEFDFGGPRTCDKPVKNFGRVLY